MPGTPNLVVDQRVHLSYEQLCRAIGESTTGSSHTPTQAQILSEVRTCRSQIASPLHIDAHRAPNPTDRSRFAGREEVVISLPAEGSIVSASAAAQSEIRLGPDLIAVSLALSDELHLNEVDTAVLLSNARARAATRPDRDVVAAAKELFAVRRRHSILYLQEILRAGLIETQHNGQTKQNQNNGSSGGGEDSFISALMRERDILVAEHSVFENMARRIREAWTSIQSQQAASLASNQHPSQSQPSADDRRAKLHAGELQLFAETIFLLAYTVQLTKDEAILLRELVTESDKVYSSLLSQERASSRPSRGFELIGNSPIDNLSGDQSATSSRSPEIVSSALVEAESVRNLILLSWMCALDRSRYRDLYNPRTGRADVNELLRDASFHPHTMSVPKFESEEAEFDPVRNLPKAVAAAEMCGAIFRLAVAEPDEQECVTSFVRLSAYNDALPFLADELARWIEKGAGALSQDADLYADVIEDLAADIAEAPHVLTPLLQFVMHDVQHLAATFAYSEAERFNQGNNAHSGGGYGQNQGSAGTGGATGSNSGRRGRPASVSFGSSGMGTPGGNAGRRASLSGAAAQRGRPPLPPSGRTSLGRPLSTREPGRQSTSGMPPAESAAQGGIAGGAMPHSGKAGGENVIGALSRFVARAIALAPSKLSIPCANGGLRYWSSLGPANWGLLHRIGEVVMDIWDVAMRNPYAPGGVGESFRQALCGYLQLLGSTCKKQDSPLHSFAALRFLAEGGHSVVSIDQLLRGLSVINGQLGNVATDREAQVDEIDCDVLGGMLNIIANAAQTLQAHGGIMAALGEKGKELAVNVGALAIHNVPTKLKEVLIRSLNNLGEQGTAASFLEMVTRDRSAALRHYLRATDAQSGDFDVTIRILELASMATKSWSDEEYPEAAIESVTRWFAIEEVLMYWGRRKYFSEKHRWEVVKVAGELIRDVVYRDVNSERSHRILAHLLTPAPGTGAASFSLRTLICTTALIRSNASTSSQQQQMSVPSAAPGSAAAALHDSFGRAALTTAVDYGLGDAYHMMQEAVKTATRIVSLLLEVSPGRMAVGQGVSIVAASELLEGELSTVGVSTSMVFTPDEFMYQIKRAGYSPVVCGAVLAMLSRAAKESDNVAALFAKDISVSGNNSVSAASEFRASLAHIISRCDPSAEVATADEDNTTNDEVTKFSIECKEHPDAPLMHSALALVEACLGRDGSSKPGIYLLGLSLGNNGFVESAQYGVLGALVELVANPSNGDDRMDSMSRATAATFLERLAANTVRSTSLAVLEHLRDVGNNDGVRGGGFADEMLFRVLDVFKVFDPGMIGENGNLSNNVQWTALGALVSACISLSALQVRLFPEHERDRCLSRRSRRQSVRKINKISFSGIDEDDDEINRGRLLPSPLELLRVLETMARCSAEVHVVAEAFKNWYLLLGTRLAVHERGEGYSQVSLLFEVAGTVLEAIGQHGSGMGNLNIGGNNFSGSGAGLAGVVKKDGGEIAGSTVLACVDRIRTCCGGFMGRENVVGDDDIDVEVISEGQCGMLLAGIVKALSEMTGIGSNAARGRTSLYTSLLITCNDGIISSSSSLSKSTTPKPSSAASEYGRVLSKRVNQQKTGTEIVVSTTCSDVVSASANAGTKCAALAALCMVCRLDGVGTIAALESQGRLRKVIQVCLADERIRSMISDACWGGLEDDRRLKAAVGLKAVTAVVEGVLGVLQIIGGCGHGMRVVAESGCVEAITSLLPSVFYRGTGKPGPLVPRKEATRGIKAQDVDMNSGGNEQDVVINDQRNAMLCSLTGTLAVAIACVGGSASVVDYSGTFAIVEGRNVLTDIVKGACEKSDDTSGIGNHAAIPISCLEMETVGNVGLMMARLPDDVVMGSDGGVAICGWLAACTPYIIMSGLKQEQQKQNDSDFDAKDSGSSMTLQSDLGLGIRGMEAESTRQARRMRIEHPEGGTLFERDAIIARAKCLHSCFAAVRSNSRCIELFNGGWMNDVHNNNNYGRKIGKLSDVVRVCEVMMKESNRVTDECHRIESRIMSISNNNSNNANDNNENDPQNVMIVGERSIWMKEMWERMCEEEYGGRISKENMIKCMKENLEMNRKHGRTCMNILESGLLILRQIVIIARDIIKGRTSAHNANMKLFNMKQSEEIIKGFKRYVLPLCFKIEGDLEKNHQSLSKWCRQICRQIRTACDDVEVDARHTDDMLHADTHARARNRMSAGAWPSSAY